ncbi:hypothetical protein M569_08397 [Genlisea aurea]|uniref:Uncharacterized protein n=1 Tax=Genlisea aurea TaxID=192259 RepID=S8CI73_9LAMI|nr:hypothetical protein M569_08397 [Genlisea aurea]
MTENQWLPLLRTRAPSPLPSSPAPPNSDFRESPPSVPFRWEEKPGVPRRNSSAPQQLQKCLELPPCRTFPAAASLSSPLSVLDCPRSVGRPKFSSFRFFAAHDPIFSPDPDLEIHSFRGGGGGSIFERWKKAGGGSFRFPSPGDAPPSRWDWEDDHPPVAATVYISGTKKMKRKGSFFSPQTDRNFLGSICRGLKQVAKQWNWRRRSHHHT